MRNPSDAPHSISILGVNAYFTRLLGLTEPYWCTDEVGLLEQHLTTLNQNLLQLIGRLKTAVGNWFIRKWS